ncbi:MAG TPA: FAD-dependent oxidoreductase, partial [Burkholderiaceae bacterium]|nr:FAD-dependent oxidoreductase [Burkholderiaceae bacterium]
MTTALFSSEQVAAAEAVDVVVVGGGAVGLAVARAFAQAGREVLVLERETAIGTGVSSRNSEVIHAGLYYEPGSLKARLCVRGKELLYAFCESHGVDHRRCGKLVVATDAA